MHIKKIVLIASILFIIGCSGGNTITQPAPQATQPAPQATQPAPQATQPAPQAAIDTSKKFLIRDPRVTLTKNDKQSVHSMRLGFGEFTTIAESDDACAQRTQLFSDEISDQARFNLEVIFGKKIDQLNNNDIKQMISLNLQPADTLDWSQSTFGDTKVPRTDLSSYDGIEYLTCLQWLKFGDSLSRDFTFLRNLSEIRFLHAQLLTAGYFRIADLQSMTKIESIILPYRFLQLPALAQFNSLKHIVATHSATCNIKPLLAMPNLEYLDLEDSQYHTSIKLQENRMNYPFTMTADPSGQYLQLLAKGGTRRFNAEPDFTLPEEETEGTHYNKRYLMEVMQSIYEIAPDIYDVIIFVGNEDESFASYDGEATAISNNTPGIGDPIWSAADCYGSEGRLRGMITFPSPQHLFTASEYGWDSPFMHELLHLWGGGNLLPYSEDTKGTFTGGHWGVTSADGILGGFNKDALEEIEPNVYRVNYFSHNGNAGLDRSLSPLEQYFMGILPAESVPETVIMRGVQQTENSKGEKGNSCEAYGYEWWDGSCFKADSKEIFTIDHIKRVFGERSHEGNVEISMLVVAVSEESLTEREWEQITQPLSWLTSNQYSTSADYKILDPIWKAVNANKPKNLYDASNGAIQVVLPKPEKTVITNKNACLASTVTAKMLDGWQNYLSGQPLTTSNVKFLPGLFLLAQQEQCFDDLEIALQRLIKETPELPAASDDLEVILSAHVIDLLKPMQWPGVHPWATAFPGLPEQNATLSSGWVEVSTKRSGQIPLGYYAPPGALVTIKSPQFDAHPNLGIIIGEQYDSLHNGFSNGQILLDEDDNPLIWERGPDHYFRYDMDTDEIVISSPYGGIIYLELPHSPGWWLNRDGSGYYHGWMGMPSALPQSWQTERQFELANSLQDYAYPTMNIFVDGAIPLAMFTVDSSTLTETSFQSWNDGLQHGAPLAILQAYGKIRMVLPREAAIAIEDPSKLINWWSGFYDSHAALAQEPAPRPFESHWIFDKCCSHTEVYYAYANATSTRITYPYASINDVLLPWKDQNNFNDRTQANMWVFAHELGHQFQTLDWDSVDLEEVTVNLFSLYTLNTYYRTSGGNFDTQLYGWANLKNNDDKLSTYRWNNDDGDILAERLYMYQVLIKQFGYEKFKETFASYYSNDFPRDQYGGDSVSANSTLDNFGIRFSKISGYDLVDYFQHWEYPLTDQAITSIRAQKNPRWMPAGW